MHYRPRTGRSAASRACRCGPRPRGSPPTALHTPSSRTERSCWRGSRQAARGSHLSLAAALSAALYSLRCTLEPNIGYLHRVFSYAPPWDPPSCCIGADTIGHDARFGHRRPHALMRRRRLRLLSPQQPRPTFRVHRRRPCTRARPLCHLCAGPVISHPPSPLKCMQATAGMGSAALTACPAFPAYFGRRGVGSTAGCTILGTTR